MTRWAPDALTGHPAYGDHSRDTFDAILELSARLASVSPATMPEGAFETLACTARMTDRRDRRLIPHRNNSF